MHKALIILLVALLGVLYALWDATRSPTRGVVRDETVLTTQRQDKNAPLFSFTGMDGTNYTLEQFKGKTVILNFWATWCPPCVAEMPQLLSLAEREKDNVVFIALSVDEQTHMVERFFKRLPKETQDQLLLENIIIGYDTDKAISKELYGTDKYPETYIISPDLQIRTKIRGVTDWLGDETKDLLSE